MYFPKEDLIGLLHLFNKHKIKVEVEDKENEVVKDTIEIVHNSENKLEVYVNFCMQKKYKLSELSEDFKKIQKSRFSLSSKKWIFPKSTIYDLNMLFSSKDILVTNNYLPCDAEDVNDELNISSESLQLSPPNNQLGYKPFKPYYQTLCAKKLVLD
jgi:hypothetical protein